MATAALDDSHTFPMTQADEGTRACQGGARSIDPLIGIPRAGDKPGSFLLTLQGVPHEGEFASWVPSHGSEVYATVTCKPTTGLSLTMTGVFYVVVTLQRR